MHINRRHISAVVLGVMYIMIALSPLASLALRSPLVTHAVTGQCAGDCSICGCSPERSASHTCCCWQKKLRETDKDHNDDQDEHDCCKKIHGKSENELSFRNFSPCNSGKSILLACFDQSDVLPYIYFIGSLPAMESSMTGRAETTPHDWSRPPPDPPPKLTIST